MSINLYKESKVKAVHIPWHGAALMTKLKNIKFIKKDRWKNNKYII